MHSGSARSAAASVRGPRDRHHVEAALRFQEIVPLQVGERQPRQPPLLGVIDRIGRMSGLLRGAGLHLDEDDRAAVDGDQVELADLAAAGRGRRSCSPGAQGTWRRRSRRAGPREGGGRERARAVRSAPTASASSLKSWAGAWGRSLAGRRPRPWPFCRRPSCARGGGRPCRRDRGGSTAWRGGRRRAA